MFKYIRFFEELSIADIPQVGGKNASLGEMFRHLTPKGVHLPNGFATTAEAYFYFLDHAGIRDQIAHILADININDVTNAEEKATRIRALIIDATFPKDLEEEIRQGYKKLSEVCGRENLIIAVRSSATAED